MQAQVLSTTSEGNIAAHPRAMAHATAQVIDLTLDEDDPRNEPPRKRQRTEHGITTAHHATSRHGSATVPDGLQATIKSRVERAIRRLPRGVYDDAALGAEISQRLIRDSSLVAASQASGSQPISAMMNMVDENIGKILAEIRYRFFLSTPRNQSQFGLSKPITPVAPPISPSKLAHRPSPSRTPSGSISNSPVPLPAYARGKQRASQPASPASPAVQESPVPFPRSVLDRMMKNAAGSGHQVNGSVPPAGKVKRETSAPLQQQAGVSEAAGRHTKPEPIHRYEMATKKPMSSQTMLSATRPELPRSQPSGQLLMPSFSPAVTDTPVRQLSNRTTSQTSSPLTTVTDPGQQQLNAVIASHVPKGKVSHASKPAKSVADRDWRPYLSIHERRDIAECVRNKRSNTPGELIAPRAFHVEMADEELMAVNSSLKALDTGRLSLDSIKNLEKRTELAPYLSSKLVGRTVSDMRNFLHDLPNFDKARQTLKISMARDDFLAQQLRRDRRINTLRLDREMNGSVGLGASMSRVTLQTEAQRDFSDSLSYTFARFGQCSGDVATMTWISESSILCGATSTMDDRTLDHNKQGNLVLYSAAMDKLEVFKEHRELRRAKEGENRDFSRDKWLYPSVVASTTDAARKLVYTAAFDGTVKIWNITGDSKSSMVAVGTWPHGGKVNFVAAALNGSGLVATAADVSTEAVRVYAINAQDPNASPYYTLSCPRHDDDGNEQWSYWPSTLQWGTAEGTQHLLAVGYSPRSRDGDENQIPEDKQRTGAILIWDSRTRRVLPVHANTVANVFEVAWHPTLPQLIVATSRSGLHVEKGVQTQIRIWKQDPDRVLTDQGWHEHKTLDCTAEDINELTVMPNSSHNAYVTASCTSGEVFVWDTARGDRPIHVLRHGPSIEPFESEDDMKRRDVGVKFTAWGLTADRLFTGSSDGKVNMWNVRKKNPFIRTVMQGEGAIFCGSFSPDKKMLAIGDGPGTVWLLTDGDAHPESWGKACPKRHVPFVPDVEDTVNEQPDDDDDTYPRRRYLDTKELVHTRNPVIGVVQGPAYHQGSHFERKSHLSEDPAGPLIPSVERQQQAAIRATQRRKRSMRMLRCPLEKSHYTVTLHEENTNKDFDPQTLHEEEFEALKKEGVEFEVDDEEFTYESE